MRASSAARVITAYKLPELCCDYYRQSTSQISLHSRGTADARSRGLLFADCESGNIFDRITNGVDRFSRPPVHLFLAIDLASSFLGNKHATCLAHLAIWPSAPLTFAENADVATGFASDYASFPWRLDGKTRQQPRTIFRCCEFLKFFFFSVRNFSFR